MKLTAAAVKESPLWLQCLVAFLAMVVADLAGTTIVIAEAHYNALASMALDEVCWLAGLVCTVYGLGDVLRERRITRRAVVLGLAISAGNLIGTYVGVAFLGHLAA